MGGGVGFFPELARRLAARERARLEAPGLRPSAVLVPLVARGEPHLVLTRKPDTLRAHAGQVAFPGGTCDPEDRDELATALRECEEELGVSRELVRPIGALDDGWVITGFKLTPWVAELPASVEYRPNPVEVARVFEVPLRELTTAPLRIERVERFGDVYEIPYFEHGGELIWGATGRIVLQLLEIALDFVPPPAVDR